jgi:predicted deacetylase
LRVHVSIHDVAPPFRAEVELALAMAAKAGATPALLVVPDYHGHSPLQDDAPFCSFLRERQKAGHEIYLHGLFHDTKTGPLAAASGLSSFFAQRVVSQGEAEMSAVSRDEAMRRLDHGERVFRDAGLRVDGFVPPAWSMPRWLCPMLAARGCSYTEDHLRVYSPSEDRVASSLVLNYASRTPMRLWSSVAFCKVAKPLATFAPARVAIHPADMRSAFLQREVASLLVWGQGSFVARGRDLFL